MNYLEKTKTMTGLEIIQAIQDGDLAPPAIGVLMGFKLLEVKDGEVTFGCTPNAHHYNPLGVVHGGLAATLLDSAVGCCIQTKLPAGTSYTTLELKVNYIRAMTTETGPVRATGKVIHVGRRSATAEGKILDQNGKLIAHATTTCIIFSPD